MGGPSSPLVIFGQSSLIGWWDFSDATKVTLDGSLNIQTILDSSGNGRTATQGTALARPGWAANGGGGNKAHGIWTTNKSLVTTATFTLPQPVEVFAIARSTSTPANTGYLLDFGINANITFQQNAASVLQQFDGSLGATQAITQNADFLADSLFSGASSLLAINGGTGSSANPGTAGSSTTPITLGNSALSSGWSGWIYGLVAINRAATTPERASMHTYAQSFGVP
jgi:hypothetical protein